MAKFFLFLIIVATGVSTLFAPWLTALSYVLNSLVQPQYLWPWIFDGVPIYKITAGLTAIAFLFFLSKNRGVLYIYKERQNLLLLSLWALMHCSNIFSPYKGALASVSPNVVLNTLNSIIIMYFIMLPLFRSEIAVRYLCYLFILSGSFYIYWANFAYFNEEWFRFVNNRLEGPSRSPYEDANVISTLIVMCLPFMIFLFFRERQRFLKVILVFLIPLAWHAMILFSSRAALLASVISLIAISYIIRSISFNILLAIAFFSFVIYQGSLLLDRTSQTIEVAQSYQEEPINPRLVSWEVGLKLIPEYPLLGAGVQMFEAAAANHFPGETPHVAHNTFLNFSVNAGLISGFIFLSFIWMSFSRLRAARIWGLSINDVNSYALVASSISIIGFFVCSMFLDLIIFEPFYMVLMINLIAYENVKNKLVIGQKC
ncbi:polymerase [Marinobacter sp. Z-F4-2]|nr:polymerase [Marinobacter sp. Z-F4-2]